MARSPVPIQVIGPAGDAVAGAVIQLKRRQDGSNATHYSAETGGSSSSGTITTDALGEPGRWATPGRYLIDITPPSPNPLGLSSRTDFPIDIAQGANITDSATIAHTLSDSDLSFAVNAGSIAASHLSVTGGSDGQVLTKDSGAGGGLSWAAGGGGTLAGHVTGPAGSNVIATTAEPQMTSAGLGVAPQSNSSLAVGVGSAFSNSRLGISVSNQAGSFFDFGAQYTGYADTTLGTDAGRRGMYIRTVTRGAGAAGGAPVVTGIWSSINDAAGVQSRTITGAAAGVITVATHSFIAGERVAIHGVTGVTAYNNVWVVASVTGTTITLTGAGALGTGTVSAASKITNAPSSAAFVAQMEATTERTSVLTGSAVNSDDQTGYVVGNNGQVMCGGGYLVAAAAAQTAGQPLENAPVFWHGYGIEANVRIGFGSGNAMRFFEAMLDTRNATQFGSSTWSAYGAHAIWLGNGHKIAANGTDGNPRTMLQMGSTDNIYLDESITGISVWGTFAQAKQNGATSRNMTFWGGGGANGNDNTPEIVQYASAGTHATDKSTRADFHQYAFQSNGSTQHHAIFSLQGIGGGDATTNYPWLQIGTVSNTPVTFWAFNTEVMRMIPGGDVAIGTRMATGGPAAGTESGVIINNAGQIDVTRIGASAAALRVYLNPSPGTGDTNPRFRIAFAGSEASLEWGPGGTGASDIFLVRAGAKRLKLDGALEMDRVDGFGYTQYREQTSTVATPAANHIRLYAKDVATVTKLFTMDSTGAETQTGDVVSGGLAGGQTLHGGTAAADELTLKPSSHGTPTGDVVVDLAGVGQSLRLKPPSTMPGATHNLISVDDAFTMGAANSRLQVVAVSSSISVTGTGAAVAYAPFIFAPTITLGSAVTDDLRQAYIFSDLAVVNLSATTTAYGATSSGWRSFRANPTFADRTGGTSTGTVSLLTGLISTPTVGTGWTVTTLRGVYLDVPGGTAGTITDHIGIDMEDFDLYAGTNTNAPLSLRSAGPLVEMRHAGLINIGNAINKTLTGSVGDDYAAGLRLDPGYTAATALTVTRHNYIDVLTPALAGAGPAAVTDAAVFRFDAAAGTHKAVDAATTKATPGGVDAWVKINVNGTIYYVPSYTSKTA